MFAKGIIDVYAITFRQFVFITKFDLFLKVYVHMLKYNELIRGERASGEEFYVDKDSF